MPGTSAQSKSRGGTGATSVSAVENSVTADLPGNPSAVQVIGNSSQGEMSGAVPTDISLEPKSLKLEKMLMTSQRMLQTKWIL